jgi:hypothetical protein
MVSALQDTRAAKTDKRGEFDWKTIPGCQRNAWRPNPRLPASKPADRHGLITLKN